MKKSFTRTLVPRKNSSFFFFGARGTGKTTLLRNMFPPGDSHWIDLLEATREQQFATNPQLG
jgi:hypothetical protein